MLGTPTALFAEDCGTEPRYPERPVFVPANSFVTKSRWIIEDCYESTRFEGSFQVSGRYEYMTTEDHVPGDVQNVELFFYVDDKDAVRLPTWSDSPPDVLWIINSADFLNRVVGPRDVARVHASKQRIISGRVTINVTDYSVGGDCDHASHLVRFVNVVQSLPPLIANIGGAAGC